VSGIEVLRTPREKKLQDMLDNVQPDEEEPLQKEMEQLVDDGEREEKTVVFDESEPAEHKEQEKLSR